MTGASQTAFLHSNNATITASGANDSMQIFGGNDTITLGSGGNIGAYDYGTGSDTFNITGNGNGVLNDGTSADTFNVSGNNVGIDDTGSSGNNIITLSGTNDTVNATTGDTINITNATNASITGNNLTFIGNGNTYQFAAGDGADTIQNGNSSNSGPSGILQLGAGFATDQVWFQQSGNNLVVDLMGTNNSMTIDNWFSSSTSQLSEIETSGGDMIDTQLAQLVQAMATYSANNSGFNSTTATVIPNDPTLQSTLAASWHS